jgi:hypothetical protein
MFLLFLGPARNDGVDAVAMEARFYQACKGHAQLVLPVLVQSRRWIDRRATVSTVSLPLEVFSL